MPETPLICTVKERRVRAGWSQADLAERAGVSRQALSAIESGRQVPSTMLALQLARALRCAVDDLFRLPGGPVVHARLASSPGGARRAIVGRVDGRVVAHPVADESIAADGLLVAAAAEADDPVGIELFGEAAALEANVLVAGCAPLLGSLATRLGQRYRDARATWIPANSARALELLQRGLVHIAGLHLADAEDPEAHARAAQAAFPRERVTLVNLARWRQGLVVAPGLPVDPNVGPLLARPGLRIARREAGAGAQRLLERALRASGARLAPPSLPAAADHAEVARLVRWGVADVGVAIESVALAQNLAFIPLAEERFDLVVPASRLERPAVARFIDLIDRPSFRAEAAGLRGYDLSVAGHASTVTAP